MRDKVLILLGQLGVTLFAFLLLISAGMAWPRLDATVHAVVAGLSYGLFFLGLITTSAFLASRLTLRRAAPIYGISTALLLGAFLMVMGAQYA